MILKNIIILRTSPVYQVSEKVLEWFAESSACGTPVIGSDIYGLKIQ